MVLGPHRVLPGRLSVSRTFGDIEAKWSKYGGKEGVIIAQPEISQFKVRPDFHDFIILGCDGIFDRMTNQTALDVSWDTLNKIKSQEIKMNVDNQKTVHQVTGAIADSLMTHAATEKSVDNLTIVMVSF
jgi:serine/threonine protein phosphatase PrpC